MKKNCTYSEDDYELPNQPVWQKDQLVKFDDIRDNSGGLNSDEEQGLTMSEAVKSWENSLKFNGSPDQMRAVYHLVASSSNSGQSGTKKNIQSGHSSLFTR